MKTQQLQHSFVHNALLKKIMMVMTPGSSVMGATYGTILSVLATRIYSRNSPTTVDKSNGLGWKKFIKSVKKLPASDVQN